MKRFLFIAITFLTLISCNRVEPNYEGVLMTDYGRNGINSFKTVTGAQGLLGPGTELYKVPMWEQAGDPAVVKVYTKDGSKFTVDPSYTYNPTRTHGPNIVLQYKNYNVDEPETFFESIERNVLNRRVTDIYKEEARKYKTADELLNNSDTYEARVNDRLKVEFARKHFDLTTLTSGLTPPKSMTDAIEARNVSIQEANKVANQLQTSRNLQDKAKIDAETNRINAAGLDNKILAARWINAIRYTQNKVIITDGKTPVFLNN